MKTQRSFLPTPHQNSLVVQLNSPFADNSVFIAIPARVCAGPARACLLHRYWRVPVPVYMRQRDLSQHGRLIHLWELSDRLQGFVRRGVLRRLVSMWWGRRACLAGRHNHLIKHLSRFWWTYVRIVATELLVFTVCLLFYTRYWWVRNAHHVSRENVYKHRGFVHLCPLPGWLQNLWGRTGVWR